MDRSDKKSFILMKDLLSTVEIMTDDEAGKMLKAILSYWNNEDINLPRELTFAFTPIKNQFDRDHKKYLDQCEKNRVNGATGGRPKKTQANPKNPSGLLETQANPKNPDNDNVTDNDNNKEDQKISRFAPPSSKEINEYSILKNLSVDAERFIDFYESKGWMVGKNKMKCWKAACRNWNRGKSNETNRPASSNQQSKAGRVSSKLDEIARKDIEENGFANTLDNRDIQEIPG